MCQIEEHLLIQGLGFGMPIYLGLKKLKEVKSLNWIDETARLESSTSTNMERENKDSVLEYKARQI